jgi:uncharacterized damage-inducible protein DinB
MKAHFEMMANYNAWANRRLYTATSSLPEAGYRDDLGAFFGSVHATLNHILVGDLLWLARFRGAPQPPFGLDETVHDDKDELAAARRVLDADIIRFTDAQSEESLVADFTYTMVTRDETVTQPLAPAMAHFFNHQTHHRGQVHALLTRLTGTAPPLDLIYFQREVA